jgi:hypothetical protein
MEVSMKNDSGSSLPLKLLALLSLLLFLGVIAVNAAANALPLNGVNTGALSDELPNLFVPAGLTFSIWGLIYLMLALYVGFVLAEAFGPAGGAAWDKGDGWLFAANEAANIGWIFAWHWRLLPLSLALMLVILGSLVALDGRITRRLREGGALAGAAPLRRFALSAPIRVYLGWILVATIANATALLVKLGWDGFGLDPRLWAVLVIAAGCAIALGFVFTRRAIATPAVVVWAFAGIVIKRLGVDRSYSSPVWIAAAAAGVAILAAILFGSILVPRQKR